MALESDYGWDLGTIEVDGDELHMRALNWGVLQEDIEDEIVAGEIGEMGGEEGWPGDRVRLVEDPIGLRGYLEAEPDVMDGRLLIRFVRVVPMSAADHMPEGAFQQISIIAVLILTSALATIARERGRKIEAS